MHVRGHPAPNPKSNVKAKTRSEKQKFILEPHHPLVVIADAKDLVAVDGGLLGPGDLQPTELIDVNVLASVDILKHVSVAVTTVGDSHRLSKPRLLGINEGTASAQPAAIESARKGEDVTLLVLVVVDDPALSLDVMLLHGTGGDQVVTFTGDGQCPATLLEDQITTLGHLANAFLEAIFKPESVLVVVLLTIWNIRSRARIAVQANVGSDVLSPVVQDGGVNVRNHRKRVIGLEVIS